MKKNTKGFTLIELLAVIVILAIIALIATPIVLNLINRARQGAAQDSAYGVRKAAQLYYQTALMEDVAGFGGDKITFASDGTYTSTVYSDQKKLEQAGFELDGTVPTAGTITIAADGTITYQGIKISNYYCHATKGGTDNMTNRGSIYCDTTANS